ncbi:unnamed protein product [Darwinula stevensoni]|uniref:Sodium channel protein n=1 Tax=Darwinula stevensoni TaxID=69355 RepID=A0A7R8X8M5_9CRUS|nr:unnamed protein product [Darwinula stevensoni]CAG0883560.1 unnamed protein product [Darwinula stevensoni]
MKGLSRRLCGDIPRWVPKSVPTVLAAGCAISSRIGLAERAMVLDALGPFHIIYFALVVFFGAFYLLNLVLAVVADAYEQEARITEKEGMKREAQEQEKPGVASLGTPPPLSSSSEDSKEKRKASLLTVEVNENLIRRLLPLTQTYLDRKTKEQKTSEAYSNFLKEGRGGGGFVQFLQGHVPYLKRMHGHRRATQSHKLVTALRRMATMEDEEVPASRIHSGPLRGFKRFLDRARGCRDPPGIDRLKVQGEELDFPRKASLKLGSHPLEPHFVMPPSEDKEDEELYHHGTNVPSHVPSDEPERETELRGESETGVSRSNELSSSHFRRILLPQQHSIADSGIEGDDNDPDYTIQIVDIPTHGDKLVMDWNGFGMYSKFPSERAKAGVTLLDEPQKVVDRNPRCIQRVFGGYGFYKNWLNVQNGLYVVVEDPCFETLVMIAIVINTICLALYHHNMDESFRHSLDTINTVLTGLFVLEAALKLLCLGVEYPTGWNIFDLIVVIVSLLELIIGDVGGTSAFRSLRLLRVFRLAQSWVTMRALLAIIWATLGALGNLTVVLLIVIYMFAVLGMQLFGHLYIEENFPDDNLPRWNFQDFLHSFLMIFRILCGEWIEPLWDCMKAQEDENNLKESCILLFIPVLVMGNFLILNLFLALLLNSFNSEDLKNREEEMRRERAPTRYDSFKSAVSSRLNFMEGEGGTSHFDFPGDSSVARNVPGYRSEERQHKEMLDDRGTPSKMLLGDAGPRRKRKKGKDGRKEVLIKSEGERIQVTVTSAVRNIVPHEDATPTLLNVPISVVVAPPTPAPSTPNSSHTTPLPDQQIEDLEESGKKDLMNDMNDRVLEPESCCPALCYKCLGDCDNPYQRLVLICRRIVLKLVQHSAFEGIILVLIILSSLSLCFEDIYLEQRPTLILVLRYVNTFFAVAFTIEGFLKIFAFGAWTYFTNFWTLLDFFIVVLVVYALMQAIPAIFNVLLVCMVFWLVFAIMGVQFFAGRFYKCVDFDGNRLPVSVVDNKGACLAQNYTWENSLINFDHVGNAYLALFQVATFEGWLDIMAQASDIRGMNLQPEREVNMFSYLYFVIFIVFGAFFTLNLFIGVIIDNFNVLKKKYDGRFLELLLTKSQKNYYAALKKLSRKKPQRVIRRPQNPFMAFFYDLSMSRRFEIVIFVVILANMGVMALDHYQQTEAMMEILDSINTVFVVLYSMEAMIKLLGLRLWYFTVPWNIFDFILLISSIIALILDYFRDIALPINPVILRVARVFRVGRILRLVRAAKGIRKLLFALAISLPALFNIGALLLLITFIYAILGTSLFGHIAHNGAIDASVNFETFPRSMLVLFRLLTAAGHSDILASLMVEPPECDPTLPGTFHGSCGTPALATFYLVSFLLINNLIIINMYIAIILENYSLAQEEEELGIVEDDIEMFYVHWAKYDPYATQFIPFSNLSDFFAGLDPPLQVKKPNKAAITHFDLPVCQDEKVHCLDVLYALVTHVLGEVEETEELKQLQQQMDDKFKRQFPVRKEAEIILTTYEWRLKERAAIIIERAWRDFK